MIARAPHRSPLLTLVLMAALCAGAGSARADLLGDIGGGLESLGDAVGGAVKEGVQGGVALSSGAPIRGQYTLPNSNITVTCFQGVKGAYVLPYGATSPSAPGTKLYPLDCDKLAQQNLLSSGPIWPGESTQPGAGERWVGGYTEANCPGIGNNRTPAEVRAHARCVDRDAGFTDDWDAMKKKHRANEQANQAAYDKKIQAIQDKSAKDFAKIQAQADAAAAAARAQAAAQAAETAAINAKEGR